MIGVVHVSARRRQAALRRAEAEAAARASRGPPQTIQLSNDDMTFLEEQMAVYDKDGNGYLDQKELANLMKDLNDGLPPTEEELKYVLEKCDGDGNEQISKQELMAVLVVWFSTVEESQKVECDCIVS